MLGANPVVLQVVCLANGEGDAAEGVLTESFEHEANCPNAARGAEREGDLSWLALGRLVNDKLDIAIPDRDENW